LTVVRSFVGVVSKFVPLIVTLVPGVAIGGENPLIDGPFGFPPIANDELLVTEPLGVVTIIGPVIAPEGTVATICVELAELMTAVVPLKLTESWLIVGLKPVPLTVT